MNRHGWPKTIRLCPKCGVKPRVYFFMEDTAFKCPHCDMRTPPGDYNAMLRRWNARYGLIKTPLAKMNETKEQQANDNKGAES